MNHEPISIPSPNLSSLGTFGEIPVSTFTGLPQIDVPLYTFNDGPFQIPITLSYHASGFRPDVHPGWAGMNWSLGASSWAITRKVNGKADDYDTFDNETAGKLNPLDSYSSRSGFYFNRVNIDTARWNSTSYLTEVTDVNNARLISHTRKDTEPDEFNFSFPTGSGKFYMALDGTWKVDCDRAVRVTFNGQFIPVPFTPVPGTIIESFGYYKTFSGFTITDIDGTQYVYGGSTNYIEYSIDFIQQDLDLWQADGWYLREIIHPSGRKVSFTYERAEYINQLMMSHSQNFGTGGSATGFWRPPCGPAQGSFREDYTGRLISPLYLKEISGTLGSIVFNRTLSSELKFGKTYNGGHPATRDIYSVVWLNHQLNKNDRNKVYPILRQWYLAQPIHHNPPTDNYFSIDYAYFYLTMMQWYRLESIEIRSRTRTTPIKSFDFHYDAESLRLCLSSIVEGNGIGDELPPYEFKYKPIDDVPYFSGRVDHWGFYNGRLPDISQLETDPSVYYNSRNADPAYAMQGMLERIVYPTSGYTILEYAGHYAGKTTQDDRSLDPISSGITVGGIRVKKVTNVNVVDNIPNQEKEYFYVSGYRNSLPLGSLSSSGVLGGRSLYLFKDFKVPASGGGFFLKNMFNSLSQLPASNNSQGSHIGYSEVVERTADGAYTIFYYKNFDNGHTDESSPTINLAFSPYGPYTTLERERGKLYKIEMFSASDTLVYRKEIGYQALRKNKDFVPAIRARSFTLCPEIGTNDRYAEGTAYKIYTYAFLPTSEMETIYDISGGNPVTISKTITYNDFRMVTAETLINSDQTTNTTKNFYPVDFPSEVPINSMIADNVIGPVVKQQFIKNGLVLETQRTQYSNTVSSNPKIYRPIYVATQRKAEAEQIRLRFHKYDNHGNLLCYSKEFGPQISYIWGYAKSYPVAEIRNVEYAVIEQALGAANIDAMSDDYDANIFSFLYNTRLTEFIAPLRTGASFENAQVTSYLYEPLIGIVSITDSNDNAVSYEYDRMRRLMSIRDWNNDIMKMYSYSYMFK